MPRYISRRATIMLVATHTEGMGRTGEAAVLREWLDDERHIKGGGFSDELVANLLLSLHGGYDTNWKEVLRLSQGSVSDSDRYSPVMIMRSLTREPRPLPLTAPMRVLLIAFPLLLHLAKWCDRHLAAIGRLWSRAPGADGPR
jgi:hypothetical protein